MTGVLATDKMTAAKVIGTFKQVVTGGELRIDPTEGRLADKELLQYPGARAAKRERGPA